MSTLALFLLGSPRIELDGDPVEINRRKATALLAYLALTGRSQSREALAALLWPEYDQSRARGALRRTLSALNTSLPGDWLEADRETVNFKREAELRVDVKLFQNLLVECNSHGHPGSEMCIRCLPLLTEAIGLYEDDFLTGFTLRNSPDFDDWQFFQAEELRRKLAGALERLVGWHTGQKEYDAAISYTRRWLNLDPLHEVAHRQLMFLYACTDQRPAALRQYQECVRILAEEVGTVPSAETTDLVERIRTGELSRGSTRPQGEREITLPPAGEISARPTVPSFLTDSPEPSEPASPFVARESELAQLQKYLDQALTGQGQVVFVVGESGSGKTALVSEFCRNVQEKQSELVVAVGNCNAHTGSGDPYLPFREILGLLSGDLESAWAQGLISRENASRLWNIFPLTGETLVEVGPDLIDTLVPAGALLSRAPTQASWSEQVKKMAERQAASSRVHRIAQTDLFEQFVRVFQMLARQSPLLLFVDDAQWADVASINLLFHLGRGLEGSRILVLVAYRPADVAVRGPAAGERHPLEAVVNELTRSYGKVQIDLGRSLERHFVDALLDTQPNRLGEEFRAALYRQTRGQPLFTVELLRAMQERGDVVRDNQGRWVEEASLNWDALPARVEAVIEERLGRLEQGVRQVMAVASVEGESFTAQVVARVQAMGERQLLRQLSLEMESRHRLVREQGEIRVNDQFLSRYRFEHTLFQQYLYNALSTGERRLLHGEVAAALEEIYAGRIEEVIVQLARHYANSGEVTKAIDYLLRAGDQARTMYAHQEAANFYQQALTLLKEKGAYDQAARTLMKLGLTYHLDFNFQQARQAYDEGFALWRRVGSGANSLQPAPHPFRMNWITPPTLDPTRAGDDTSLGLVAQLFSGLVSLSPDSDVVPEVARRWQVLEGGRQYLFYLRNDVRWSDGTPVTAADYVYSWRRMLSPAFGSPSARYLFDIKGARAFFQGELSDPDQIGVRDLDDFTLEVKLEGPTGYFLQLLAQLYPVPRHIVERYGERWTENGHFVTNGAFELRRWQPGQVMVLHRNPAYWGEFRGNVQQLELMLDARSEVDRFELYTTDRLDVLRLLLPTELSRVQSQFAEEYFTRPILNVQYVGFNVLQPPFDDQRIRRAFALALDQEMMAGVLFGGFHFPATGGFVPSGMPGHSPDIGLPYDPEQARQLLAEAGYPEGNDFPPIDYFFGEGYGGLETEYLQKQWRDILGIKLVLNSMEWGVLLDWLDQMPPGMFRMGWGVDYPDPDNPLGINSPVRWSKWQHKSYAELIEKARRLTNQPERMKLYQQADRILVEEVPIIPLFYGRHHMLVKPWISHISTLGAKGYFYKDIVIEPH